MSAQTPVKPMPTIRPKSAPSKKVGRPKAPESSASRADTGVKEKDRTEVVTPARKMQKKFAISANANEARSVPVTDRRKSSRVAEMARTTPLATDNSAHPDSASKKRGTDAADKAVIDRLSGASTTGANKDRGRHIHDFSDEEG